uniref:Uncharacterized protein n=1 Tax=Opuntia streptacantha TaxID=393608 RepID=A0A7C9AYW0_OPUST
MNKPLNPTLTLVSSILRRFHKLSLAAVDVFLSPLSQFSSCLAFPLWLHSQSLTGIDEYPSSKSRSLSFESKIHHYQAVIFKISWVMVNWKHPASNLFMIDEEEKLNSESRQIF